jgi:hypothetical protein
MQNSTTFHPIHSYKDGVANTQSGKLFNLLHPQADEIDIEDIAQSLSNICRFGGHLNQFYSVAQHSVLVAHLAPQSLKPVALLHDAAEAYLGDVIKPLKYIIGTVYEELETKFITTIFQKFGLDADDIEQISHHDKLALEIEQEFFRLNMYMRFNAAWESAGYDAPGVWSPITAKFYFMKMFHRLFPQHINGINWVKYFGH